MNHTKHKSVTKVCLQGQSLEKEEGIQHIRSLLHLLVLGNIKIHAEKIIKIDTADKVELLVDLILQKAMQEPRYTKPCAVLCSELINTVKRMDNETIIKHALFRSSLLDKVEREFIQYTSESIAKDELNLTRKKIDNCTDAKEKLELETALYVELRKKRCRYRGLVRFIAELFNVSILTIKIVNLCIEALLKAPNDVMMESLCVLLTTAGQKYEQTCVFNFEDSERKYSLESTIERMQHIASQSEKSEISSPVRFMMQDVIDLRKKNFQSSTLSTESTVTES